MANQLRKAGYSLSEAFRKAWQRVKLSMTVRAAGVSFENRQERLQFLQQFKPEDLTVTLEREKEKAILRDLEDGIRSSDSKKMTLNDLIEIYLENHRSIRKVTEISYRKTINAHIKDSFIGNKPIASIRNSDMIKFYNGLLDKGLSSGYLHIIHAFLHPAFEMAAADDLIRKNPCSGVMSKIKKTETVKKSYDD